MCVRGEEWLTGDKGALASFLLSDSPAAKKYSGAAESSFATRKISSEPEVEAAGSRPSARTLSEDQQEAVTTQPDIQAPQHCSSFPATLDAIVRQQHRTTGSATLPLYCLPPPVPPKPPSYTQSLAKSQFCRSESPPEPPAYASSTVVTQPLKSPWTPESSSVSNEHPNQVLRRIQSFTSSMSGGAASNIPSTVQISSQKLSRPTSTSHGRIIKKWLVLDQPCVCWDYKRLTHW